MTEAMAVSLSQQRLFSLDYAEVADPDELTRPNRIEAEVGCSWRPASAGLDS